MTLGSIWRVLGFRNPGPLSAREVQSFVVWGLTAAVFAFVELAGVLSSSITKIFGSPVVKWPTLSTTTGHLEARWHWVAVLVVGIEVGLVLLVVKKGSRFTVAEDPRDMPFSWQGLAYDLVSFAVVGAGAYLVSENGASKDQLGDTIYGLIIALCIVVPSVWALCTSHEPTLISAVRSLHKRVMWLTTLIVCALAVLFLHLGLYPWPDFPHVSSKVEGVDGAKALTLADKALGSRRSHLVYRTEQRGFVYRKDESGAMVQHEAWLVYFDPPNRFGSGCVVSVSGETHVRRSAQCG